MAAVEISVPARVLAIYAHPDDPDVSAGGTLAAWSERGAHIEVCICTEGDKGSADPSTDLRDLVRRRRQEVVEAGRILGVAGHHWLDFPDGELDDGPALRGRLVELVRRVRPDAVVGPDPTAVYFGASYVNHRDHRVVGWAVLDAVAPAAANPHYFPDLGPPHAVATVWLSGTLEPDAWVDISTTVERKARAVGCHVSQTGEPGEWLRTVVAERAEVAGRQAGVRHAESFRRLLLG